MKILFGSAITKFNVVDMNAKKWNPKNVHKNLKEQLAFPDYYGENLNAFRDCFSDMYNERYRGLVMIFRHFDAFAEHDKSYAEMLLDIIAKTSREWLLTGQKLICLIQSNDPDIWFKEVGGNSPAWNNQEWLDADWNKPIKNIS